MRYIKLINKKGAVIAVALGFLLLTQGGVVAAQSMPDPVQSARGGVESISGSKNSDAKLDTSIKDIVNVFLFIAGALSVIMIIFGGFRYITSAGESSAVSSAKNTVLYAVVGLIVVVLAYAIVNFVVGSLRGENEPWEAPPAPRGRGEPY